MGTRNYFLGGIVQPGHGTDQSPPPNAKGEREREGAIPPLPPSTSMSQSRTALLYFYTISTFEMFLCIFKRKDKLSKNSNISSSDPKEQFNMLEHVILRHLQTKEEKITCTNKLLEMLGMLLPWCKNNKQ
jgi:hypothetical protein